MEVMNIAIVSERMFLRQRPASTGKRDTGVELRWHQIITVTVRVRFDELAGATAHTLTQAVRGCLR